MKVKCAECYNQTDGICKFKKSAVKPNKRRICEKFELDENKVKEKTPIPTTRRPDWWHKREELRRDYKKKLKELQEKTKEQELQNKYLTNPHPLTGNLDSFIKSTASKNEE